MIGTLCFTENWRLGEPVSWAGFIKRNINPHHIRYKILMGQGELSCGPAKLSSQKYLRYFFEKKRHAGQQFITPAKAPSPASALAIS